MANQSYPYGYDSGGEPRRSGNRRDFGFWVLALIFLFTITPVGVLMIVLKLAGGGRKRTKTQGRHPYYIQQEQARAGARTVQMGGQSQTGRAPNPGTVPSANILLSQMASKGKRLTTVGIVLSAIFGFVSLNVLVGSLWMLPDIAWYLESVIFPLCGLGAGLGCLWAGLRRQKRVRGFRSYLAMIGSRNTVSISALSSAMGVSPAKVRDTLEDMLDEGFFPLGYLDYGNDRLVLTSDGIRAPPKEEEPPVLPELWTDPDSSAATPDVSVEEGTKEQTTPVETGDGRYLENPEGAAVPTGDDGHLGMYALLTFLFAGGLMGLLLTGRKPSRKKSRNKS